MDLDKLFGTGLDLVKDWGSAAIDAKYRQPYAERRFAIEQLGFDGMLYAEGQRGAVPAYYRNGGMVWRPSCC